MMPLDDLIAELSLVLQMGKLVWVWFSFFLFVVAGNAYGAQAPAMFVFGDSLFDPGNNNHLLTVAKGNYPHYGIDFPTGATGRFCNGATIADHLGFLLGFGLIPALNDPTTRGSNVLQGVNFASGGAGILNNTGNKMGQIIPLSVQVNAFENKILPLLSSQVLSFNGKVLSTEDFLAKSIFFLNFGNNDFLNHYFLPIANPFRRPVPPDFADSLIAQYTNYLKDLYKHGARKFLVTSLAPVGCAPMVIASYNWVTNQCYEPHNKEVVQFNIKLKLMIQQLNKDLPSAYFLYWDLYSIMKQVIDNPSPYGFKYAHTACCGVGRANGETLCSPAAFLCHNRSEYIFWDAFHPTDASNKIAAGIAYEGTLQNTFPVNVKQFLSM